MIALFFLLSNFLYAQTLGDHNLGSITQLKGRATFFPFQGPRQVMNLVTKSSVHEGGSYLSHENSYFTVKLFDGSWLKVSPSSKFSLDMDLLQKEIHMNLYSGSVKVLFAGSITKSKMQKFIIQSGDGRFETSEAKFSVFRNTLESTVHVYVEKGLVRISRVQIENGANELVHGQEMASLKDRDSTLESPRKISEGQMKFLNSSFYLGDKKPND